MGDAETPRAGTDPGAASTLPVLVRQIRFEGRGINSYELTDPGGAELPPFSAGAHIDLHLPGGVARQYSLCNDPAERRRYVIAVLKDGAGRGGSVSVHQSVHVQDIVRISPPRNNFGLVDGARKMILLAGGIGVTPLKSMAHSLERAGVDFELHYCTKEAAFVAFEDEMKRFAEDGRLHYHFDGGDPQRGLDLAALLATPSPGTHVYCCGPGGFMTACASAASAWPEGSVHFEHFKAPVVEPGRSRAAGAFTVEIASSGRRIEVGAEESIATVLNRAGVPVETSCESGLCGTCKTRYTAGTVEHRDYILDDAERHDQMTLCVSRCRSEVLVLDL